MSYNYKGQACGGSAQCENVSSFNSYYILITSTYLTPRLISWATEPSIWPLLEKITCAEDIEEMNM